MRATQMARLLRDAGGLPGAPTRVGQAAQQIDRQACADSPCEECGHQGLSYQPWDLRGAYVAIAICPACGHAEEF